MNIKSIDAIKTEAITAAGYYTDINSACPYPFGSDAAHHFERAFSAELARLRAAEKYKNENHRCACNPKGIPA